MADNQTTDIVLSSAQDQLLNQLLASVPRSRQLAWLQLSGLKMSTEKQLEGKILEIQQALTGWETMELIPLQAAVDKVKKILNEVPELRKSFTRYIDNIGESMMAIQKRAEGLEIVAKANARELQLRLAQESKDKDTLAKSQEAANFKAHVQNEYVRISSTYKIALINGINEAYTKALDENLTDDGLIKYIHELAEELKKIERSPAVKFNYTLHQADELNKIHATIPAPNYNEILTLAIGSLAERFKLYHQDVQNKDLAKAQVQKETAAIASNVESQAQKTQAVNNLVSKGTGGAILDTLPGAKKVKRKTVIKLQDTSEDTIKIISAFIANWSEVAPLLKIKSWAKLDVQKMANALSELDQEIEGLVYETIVK